MWIAPTVAIIAVVAVFRTVGTRLAGFTLAVAAARVNRFITFAWIRFNPLFTSQIVLTDALLFQSTITSLTSKIVFS